MSASFTHLHTHTEYSMLDGLCQIDPLLQRAKDLGMDSLALTDHGVLHGAIQFYTEATGAGIKPIIGMEGYLAQGSRLDRSGADKQPHHITLLAKSEAGYHNLLKLGTRAQKEGYYYKPRTDHALLEEYHEGLIVFSGCLNGEIPRMIQSGRLDDARETTRWYQDIFGPDFYFELQHHENIPELADVNSKLLDLARDLHVPLVATNDVHYIGESDHETHDVLLCVQTNSTVGQAERMRMSDPSYFLRSSDQMGQLFSHLPEAIANTRRIADQCDLSIDFSKVHLPRFPVPEGRTADSYLAELCEKGFQRRYPQPTEELRERLAYELDVIRRTQFQDYFLVVWDISRYVREKGILMGVRGSAAASLVLYCLFITNVDPMRYRLVFERFLNIERKEMPDIDMDFQDDRRDEVMSYVVDKYGHDRVAQIVTFGTMGAKAVLRDVGRVQGLGYSMVDEVARLIPTGYRKTERGQIKGWNITDALELLPEFKEKYDSDYVVKNLVETGKKLEGVVRNTGTHAAGVVIGDEPLDNYVPLMRPAKGSGEGMAVTQFSMDAIAKLGLLKMDFLGLVNLNILQKARKNVSETKGLELDILEVPLDNAETFGLLSSGDTSGLFQLESTGMRRYIKELKPTSLGDLSAMIALYRPGPLEEIPRFIESKHGRRQVSYPHPILKDVLEETYGVIVYQDQVLLILQQFAGYSLGQADIVRKAMGKKIASLMEQEAGRFIDGAKGRGFSEEIASQVWDLIEPFAGYAFNKAHSISYALIAYWTAYFKANYPLEYMAALLTCYQGVTEKVATTVAECTRLGIPVLPPDINQSDVGFTVEDNAIRFGLGAIKNVGQSAVRPLIDEARAHGPFAGPEDFCRRAEVTGLNRRAMESLIKVGAFESIGSRGGLLTVAERLLSVAGERTRLRQSGQTTMFDLFGDTVEVPMPEIEIDPEDAISARERATWEKELIGVALSAEDPLARVSQILGPDVTFCGAIDADMSGQPVTIAGRVATLRMLQTRKDGRSFVVASLEDLQGSIEVTVWPNVYEKTAGLWQQDSLLVIKGTVRVRQDQPSVVCDEAELFEEAAARSNAAVAPAQVADVETRPIEAGNGDDLVASKEHQGPDADPDLNDHMPSPLATWADADELVPPGDGAIEETPVTATPGPIPERQAAAQEFVPAQPLAETGHYNGGDGHATLPTEPGVHAPQPSSEDDRPRTLCLNLRETDDEQADLARLEDIFQVLRAHPGTDPVRLKLSGGNSSQDLLAGVTVACTDDLLRGLMTMLGPSAVRVA